MKKTITPGPTHDPMVPPGLTFHRGRGFLLEEVYACLKNAILSRKFQPQARLIEEVVARELGVSRTPVRESLHKLEKEGLIEHVELSRWCRKDVGRAQKDHSGAGGWGPRSV
jgi:DNA-binding transcriptional MocR family regulator